MNKEWVIKQLREFKVGLEDEIANEIINQCEKEKVELVNCTTSLLMLFLNKTVEESKKYGFTFDDFKRMFSWEIDIVEKHTGKSIRELLLENNMNLM